LLNNAGGRTESTRYTIDPENIGHITGMLRNMYSDPILAVVREYVANALDAHVASGATAKIQITLPTIIQPEFKVRDFGGGLNREDTQALLYSFGSSGEDKRRSNDQRGGFGIGCKCGFAVADSFSYTIWHAGTKKVWNCYLDEDDQGRADLVLDVADTESPAGIEVAIPIPDGDRHKVRTALQKVFRYTEPLPEIVNDPEWEWAPRPIESRSVEIDLKVGDARHRLQVCLSGGIAPRAGLSVVMGGDEYRIRNDQLPTFDSLQNLPGLYLKSREEYPAWLRCLTVKAPIGLLALAPSREDLQYSTRTQKTLAGLVHTLVREPAVEALRAAMQSEMQTADLPRATGLHKLWPTSVNEGLRFPPRATWMTANTHSLMHAVTSPREHSLIITRGAYSGDLRVNLGPDTRGAPNLPRTLGLQLDDTRTWRTMHLGPDDAVVLLRVDDPKILRLLSTMPPRAAFHDAVKYADYFHAVARIDAAVPTSDVHKAQTITVVVLSDSDPDPNTPWLRFPGVYTLSWDARA